MKFYEFGNPEHPIIFLLPGTCCHWKRNFGEVIPLLEKDFFVVCVSYDGFDETEDGLFPDMLTETAKMEAYIRTNFNGSIHAAYGCSLGGSFVSLLIQRRQIHVNHGIIGSSDMDQSGNVSAKLQGRLMAAMLFPIFKKGKLPGWMQRRLDKKPVEEQAYATKFTNLFCGDGKMAFVKKKSIYNQFYSDLVTPVEDQIAVDQSIIHCFYATKMGEKYLKRYEKHFANPDICPFALKHEELLIQYPEKWAKEVGRCWGL